MCGIFGYVRIGDHPAGPSPDPGRMAQALKHRGPDHMGLHDWAGGCLGNQRLSIIDLSGGNQPFYSPDRSVAVVQNGEIYNYIELRDELRAKGVRFDTDSDTEVILRLYEYEGPGFVSRLNGMFAIAIHDARSGEVHLYRDRMGVKPLYLAEDAGRLLFASEIKSLLAGGVPAVLNPEAIDLYLTYNYVPPPLTAFKGIRHLPPGTHAVIGARGVREERWWKLEEYIGRRQDESAAVDTINELLSDAVQVRLRADVSFGAFLSGGIDSATVVTLMKRHLRHEILTYTVGFDSSEMDESSFAEAASRRIGTRHHCIRADASLLEEWPRALYHCDQPHGDTSFLPTLAVSTLAARDVRMVLTGDGGDEIFAGYVKYAEYLKAADGLVASSERFRRGYLRANSLFSDEDKAALYTSQFKRQVSPEGAWEHARPIFEDASAAEPDPVNAMLYFDCRTLLPGNNLMKPDRMGMAVSLEARSPFMDYRLVQEMFGYSGALKLNDGETKAIFKKAIAPLIGEGVAYRAKRMFSVPIAKWLEERYMASAERRLCSGGAWLNSYLSKDGLRGLFGSARAGNINEVRKIRALIALEIWAQSVLNSDSASKAQSRHLEALLC